MSHFIYDGMSLPVGKQDRPGQAAPKPANQAVTASEWNRVAQAALDIQSCLGDWGVNVLTFGVHQGGILDAAPGLNAALQAHRTGQVSGRLVIPPGRYRLASSLVIESAAWLDGPGAVLVPDDGVTAIVVAKGALAPHGGSADNARVSGITIEGPVSYTHWTGTAASGIVVAANGVSIDRVGVRGMQTHGIEITSAALGSNANCFKLYGLTIYYCGGDGVAIHGGDANAGASYDCTAVGCGGSGLNDYSFLGNSHYRFHTEANITFAFRVVGANNQTKLDGCYSESDQVSYCEPKCLIIGGDHGAPITGGATIDLGYARNQMLVEHELSIGDLHFDAGEQAATQDQRFLSLRIDSAERLSIQSTGLRFGRDRALLVSGERRRRFVPPGLAVVPTDIFANYQGFGRGFLLGQVLHSSAPGGVPPVGDYAAGDVIWAESEAPSGAPAAVSGYRCLTSGTVGTYSEGRTASVYPGCYCVVLSAPSAVLRPGHWLDLGAGTPEGPLQLYPTQPWTAATPLQADVNVGIPIRSANGGLYQLTTDGTTAATGTGPGGTGIGIVDGTAVWKYLGPADRTIQCAMVTLVSGTYSVAFASPAFAPFVLVHPGRAAVTQTDTAIVVPAGAGERITLELTSAADITFSATPLIAARPAGSEVTLVNAGTHTLTMTDDRTLAGSKVILASGTTLALAPGGMVRLLAAADGTHNEILRFA